MPEPLSITQVRHVARLARLHLTDDQLENFREQLSSVLAQVASGDALLAPSITRRLIEEFSRRPVAPAPPAELAELTDREREVLVLMARGLSNAEIAAQLFVAETTVKTHEGRVLNKLRLRDRAQAVVLAYESGLVQPGA